MLMACNYPNLNQKLLTGGCQRVPYQIRTINPNGDHLQLDASILAIYSGNDFALHYITCLQEAKINVNGL